MKKIIQFILILLLVWGGVSIAETPSSLWPATFEGKLSFPQLFSDGENGALLLSTNILGYSGSYRYMVTNSRAQARRIGSNGNILWVSDLTTTLPSSNLSANMFWGKSLARATDGNYLIGYFVRPLGTSGGVKWKTITGGGASFDHVSDSSSGIYTAGKSGTNVLTGRLDKDGSINWLRSISRNANLEINKGNVSYPVVNRTGNDCVVVWQEATPEVNNINQSSSVYLLRYSDGGDLFWWSPLRVSSVESGDVYASKESFADIPVVVSSEGAGVVVFWRQDKTNKNLWAAKVDKDGNILWRKKYDSVSDITQIKAGAFGGSYYAAWLNSDGGLYVGKFEDNGEFATGYPLLISGNVSNFHLLPDGQGGVVIAYFMGTEIKGYICRVRSEGISIAWNKSLGNSFCLGLNPFSSLTSDSFMIAYTDTVSDTLARIKVRKVRLSDGGTVWEQTVDPGGFNYEPMIVDDGAGGVLVCFWNRDSQINPGISDFFAKRIYVQRVSSEGVVWKNATAILVESSSANDLVATALYGCGVGQGNVWVSKGIGATESTWVRVSDMLLGGLYAQKLRYYDGSKLWGSEGIALFQGTASEELSYLGVASDESGGGIFTWATGNNIYAQWVDENGNLLLGSGGVLVEGDPTSMDDNPRVAYVGGNKALIYWDAPDGKVKIRSLTKGGTLGTVYEETGNVGPLDVKDSVVKGGKLYFTASVSNYYTCYVRNSDGSGFARINAPAGTGFAHICADENYLYMAYPVVSSKGVGIFINRVAFSSLNSGSTVNLSMGDAWAIFSSSTTLESVFPFLFGITPDNAGGVVVLWTDFRNFSLSEVVSLINLMSSAGPEGILDPVFSTYNFEIYAQRIDSGGNRLWGDTGFLVGSGIKAQLLLDALAGIPNGSSIFSYLDASQATATDYSWLAEALTKVQKVGPLSSAGNVTTAVDGRPLSGGIMVSSSKPIVSVATPNYSAVRSIKIYVNNELKFEKTSEITALNDFTLDLIRAGSYDIKIVVVDTNGNESVISFTLNSLGAQVVGIVGAMIAAPSPYVAAAGNATIAYVLASDTNTRLVIVSPTGELVMNKTFAAGTPGGMSSYNAVVWDGKLPTGEKAGTGIYPVKLFDATTGKELGKTYIVVK